MKPFSGSMDRAGRIAVWVLMPFLVKGLWLAGCAQGPALPPGGTTNGNGNNGAGSGGGATGAPITSENVAEFADALDRTVAAAIEDILADPGLIEGKKREGAGKTGPHFAAVGGGADSINGVTVDGVRGSVLANGLRFGAFWPPRFEITLTFDGYETNEGLALDGTVEYNFVRDDHVDPPQEFGLQAGTLTVSGRFSGELTVQSSIVGPQRSTKIVTAAGGVLQVGALAQTGFITYVSTIAGTGEAGLLDGPATQAKFHYPTGIALDDDGRIYVADSRNAAIREIDLDGTVSTVTTGVQEPYDIGFDSKGLLVVSDQLGGSHYADESPLIRLAVRGDARGAITAIMPGGENPFGVFPLCPTYSCDGRPPLSAMSWPAGIDVRNQSVLVAQVALGAGLKLVLPNGYLMTVLDLDYVLTTTCDETFPGSPQDLVQGNNGEIYYTTGCHAVRVLNPDGTVRTLAGRLQTGLEFADGVGDAARFAYPEGLVFDDERYLYVADSTNGLIRRVDIETGEVVRVAGCVPHTDGLECDDDLMVRDGPGDHARFNGPHNIAISRWGDLYIAEARANVIRLVRILADPDRMPSVHRFDPAVMQQGDSATMTISGRNLTTLQSVDLGPGVAVTLERTGYQRVTAAIAVAEDAPPGPRHLTITTAFGAMTTPDDLSLTILADTRGGIQVETIAGTGSAEPDPLNYGPAQNTHFAFPGGIHAISSDRLLVADPVEHRIRLIATRTGAVEEFAQLLTYAATGTDVDVLGTITGALDSIEHTLDFLGLGSGIVGQTEDAIRNIAEQSIDAICDNIGADDCTWLSLPWAGIQYVPGQHDGFRMTSTFFLPTDIWADAGSANSRFYVADSGNSVIRVIGYNIEQQSEAPMQVFSTDEQSGHPFAVTPLGTSLYASLPSALGLSQLSTNSGAINYDWATIPRGVPLGIASGADDFASEEQSIFVADPLNATVWRVINNGGVSELKNIRGDFPSVFFGDCMDGPATFATWGAPMDVAVDQSGNVYVADAGCNSIRMIRDAGFGQDLDGLVGSLREFVASNKSRISAEAAQRIEENLQLADTEFLDNNRYMVTTLAGSPDGQPGFADGAAAVARFNSPTSVALASTGESTIVFVADTGNRRIRRIVIP